VTFEKFTERKGRFQGPRITVGRSGVLGINQSCYAQFFKGKEKAILYFDKEAGQIGIEPTDSSESYAYRVRRSKNSKSRYISAVSFLKRYGIMPEKTIFYSAEWSDENGFVVAMKEDGPDKGENSQDANNLFD